MNLVTIGWTGMVGGAGALGALVRYFIGRAFARRASATFPWATLVINVSGSFLIGLIAGLTSQHVVSPLAQTVLATGFLGGYTTFSTMSWEAVSLFQRGRRFLGMIYLGGNVAPGLLAALLGLLLGGWL
jgi:CrcB protein